MDFKIFIEWFNGKTLEVKLPSAFSPKSDMLEILDPRDLKSRVIPLNDLSSIRMCPAKNPRLPKEEPEQITTAGGNIYRVVQLPDGQFESGFFAYTLKDDIPEDLIFFTRFGVRTRVQERPVGEILREKGAISEHGLEIAVNEQRALRTKRVGDILSENAKVPKAVIDETLKQAEAAITSAGDKAPKRPMRVGEILVEAGIVTDAQVDEALKAQDKGRSKKIGTLLIEKGFITEDQLMSALAAKFRLRHVDLETIEPTREALGAVTFDIVRKFKILPIELSDQQITVATSDPTYLAIDDTVRFHTKRSVQMVVASAGQIEQAIDKYYRAHSSSTRLQEILDDMIDSATASRLSKTEGEMHQVDENDSTVIGLVGNILLEAYRSGVSDIHVETGLDRRPTRIRYRVDGICTDIHEIPANHKYAIISRIKILAGLDIAEHRKPQSGKILLRTTDGKAEFRVEITPTVGGVEDAVLRVLTASRPFPLHEMGFSPDNLEMFEPLLRKPYGMILCVGPTGSGKTTTLHSALSHINTPERKIWTAEDPVEITQERLRQVQINPRVGFSFQDALRSFLRADPDVIMIGEMRDVETAKIAIQASLTGHLVFSTLHTNSAPETVVRLIDMGMDPLNFSDAFLGILAQRLPRRFCGCRTTYHPDEDEFNRLRTAYGAEWYEAHQMPPYTDTLMLARAEGCEHCNHTGYRGRFAIHELMVGSEAVRVAIKKGETLEVLRQVALENGMRTLRMDGIHKMFLGLTDFSEINRVCL